MRFLLSIGTRSFGFVLIRYFCALRVSVGGARLIVPDRDRKDDARSVICGSILYPDLPAVGFDNSFVITTRSGFAITIAMNLTWQTRFDTKTMDAMNPVTFLIPSTPWLNVIS